MEELNLNSSEVEISYNNDISALMFYLIVPETANELGLLSSYPRAGKYEQQLNEFREPMRSIVKEYGFPNMYIVHGIKASDYGKFLVYAYQPKIGMSDEQVKTITFWGNPDKVNRDTNKYGVSEQWVYDYKGYLYFDDGILTSIQER